MTATTWSKPVDELSARARIELEDLAPGLRHAIHVELRNHSLRPIAITSQPRVDANLTDSFGEAVTPSGLTVSGPLPDRQWAVIPRDGYVGLRVDMQNVGLPTRAHGVALIAVGGKAWQVAAGRYTLRLAVAFEPQNAPPASQWTGRLDLPSVFVTIDPGDFRS